MTYKEYLFSGLSDITCCFGGCYNYWSMSAFDLLMFGLGSFILISILLFYYSKIPKSNFIDGDNRTERKTSRLPIMLAYLLVIIPSIILSVDFFNYGNIFSMFDTIVLISITTLIVYSNITPEIKKRIKISYLNNPIYQTKDILLQSNSLNVNFIIADKTTSTWVKVIIFIMIVVISFTPLYQLLGIGYF